MEKRKDYSIVEIPASNISRWAGGAWTICFVFTKNHGNFILKGYHKEVMNHLKKHFTHYFCNCVLYGGGRNRNIWYFWKDRISIHEPNKLDNKFRVVKFGKNYSSQKLMEFKRFPKRWVPEFDTI